VVAVLAGTGRRWPRVLEPTCGTGAFLRAARVLGADQLIGVEINAEYARAARVFGEVITGDVFGTDLDTALPWRTGGDLLVVGNPPWVTTAALTRLGASNGPARRNVHGLSGQAARTGAANFDLAEAVWHKLIADLADQQPTIALLCKTAVARNVLGWCAARGVGVAGAALHLVDARRWFGAAVSAGLFVLDVRAGASNYTCPIHDGLGGRVRQRIGVVGGRLVADVAAYVQVGPADGDCHLEWRQGIKHDAARVMESRDPPDVEPDHLFPLLKGADLAAGAGPSRWMVVPQRSLADDPAALAGRAPRLWRYLTAHGDVLDARRSSIYRGRPRFSIFGVGPYAFAPYKVAVSGLHKTPEFRVVGPVDGRPVVFDDTCYFLPFADGGSAASVAAVLRSAPARALLGALLFPDAKRPVTKRLLQRLDLHALAALAAAPGPAAPGSAAPGSAAPGSAVANGGATVGP
jgi:hypothetical protein